MVFVNLFYGSVNSIIYIEKNVNILYIIVWYEK